MRTRHSCPHKHPATRIWGHAAYTALAWSYCQTSEVHVSVLWNGKDVARFRFRVRTPVRQRTERGRKGKA